MMWMRLAYTTLFTVFLSGCSRTPTPDSSAPENSVKTEVIVTSWPLLQMTQAILGQQHSVECIVPDGISSPEWSPTSQDASRIQQAGLILLNGAGYEPWKDRVSLPRSRVRDTAAGYYDQLIRIPDAVTHQHGPEGSHSHPGTVWATWLDPELCSAQLHQISLQCARFLPDEKTKIETTEAKLSAELQALNTLVISIKEATESLPLSVFADAPHYQYLTQRLGWESKYLHWSASDSLTDANRAELTERLQVDVTETNKVPQRLFLLDSRHSVDTENFVRQSGVIVIRIDLCETQETSPHQTPPEEKPPVRESQTLPNRLKQNLQRILAAVARSA